METRAYPQFMEMARGRKRWGEGEGEEFRGMLKWLEGGDNVFFLSKKQGHF